MLHHHQERTILRSSYTNSAQFFSLLDKWLKATHLQWSNNKKPRMQKVFKKLVRNFFNSWLANFLKIDFGLLIFCVNTASIYAYLRATLRLAMITFTVHFLFSRDVFTILIRKKLKLVWKRTRSGCVQKCYQQLMDWMGIRAKSKWSMVQVTSEWVINVCIGLYQQNRWRPTFFSWL